MGYIGPLASITLVHNLFILFFFPLSVILPIGTTRMATAPRIDPVADAPLACSPSLLDIVCVCDTPVPLGLVADMWRYEIASYLDTTSGLALAMTHRSVYALCRPAAKARHDNRACCDAAASGRVAQLAWLRRLRYPWATDTCAAAAGGGHLAALTYAREHGCPWDLWTCAAAAGGGHMAALTYAREHGCPWDAGTCAAAAGGGHLAALTYAREHGCHCLS
jgi:hypothetical protein